ncbi:MAG: acyloxyacyl hydrolase [Lewinellaceae bacterium]|nr:acyloxyacyl hydrolase [Lewinellaceae bacterium]
MKNYRKNKWPGLLLLLLLWQAGVGAQIAIESDVYAGAIWRHTPKLTTETAGIRWGQELSVRFQTDGRRDWHQWHRYPAFGVSLLHMRLGEGSHGDAFALLPQLSVPVFRWGRFAAFFRLGTGLARVSDPYDYFKNPEQNAIGSHWNNITQFRLGGEFRFDDHLRVNAGVALTHFSNGGAALPNYGINLPSAYTGLVWSPHPIRESDFLPAAGSKKVVRHFGTIGQAGLARIEYAVFDGPGYPVWCTSVAGYYRFNRVNRALLGIDHEFNRAVFEYGQQAAFFENEAAARKGATRLALFAADEFLFGSIGVQLQMGFYIGDGFNQLVFKKQYSKLSTRYYFPAMFKTPLQAFTGITLKAHAFTAEYISGNIGLAF